MPQMEFQNLYLGGQARPTKSVATQHELDARFRSKLIRRG